MQRDNLRGLMDDTELALLPVLVTMQRHGIKMDAGVLHEMSADLYRQMAEIENDIYQSIGHTVNINSPQQLSALLFQELGLPKTKRTKTGYSTDANALEGLKGIHPVVDQILEYRQVSKLKSTYVDALPDMINPHTGRVHTSYKPDRLRHWPHIQQRPEFTEHPHSYRAGPTGSPRFRCRWRARLAAFLR